MTRIFTLPKNSYKRDIPKILLRLVFFFPLIIAFLVFIQRNDERADVDFWLTMTGLFVVVFVLSIWRTITMQRKNVESYRLIVEENQITREHRGVPDMRISRDEISGIHETPEGSLLIKTDQQTRFIFIPAYIENREGLLEAIEPFGVVQPQLQSPFWQRYAWMSSIGILVLMGLHFKAETKWLIISSGLTIVAVNIYCLYAMWRYRNLIQSQLRSKWMMVFMLIFTASVGHRVLRVANVFGTEAADVASAHFTKSKKLIKAEEFEEAIGHLDSAVALQPNQAAYYMKRAEAKLALEDYESALNDCNAAIKLEPNLSNFTIKRGYIKYMLEDYAGAMEDLNKAIQLDDLNPDAYIYRAYVKERENDFEGAEQDYKQAIEVDQDNLDAYFYRGMLRMQKGNKKGACEDWQKQLELGDKTIQDTIQKYCQ